MVSYILEKSFIFITKKLAQDLTFLDTDPDPEKVGQRIRILNNSR